jgi:hypothetical protein
MIDMQAVSKIFRTRSSLFLDHFVTSIKTEDPFERKLPQGRGNGRGTVR